MFEDRYRGNECSYYKTLGFLLSLSLLISLDLDQGIILTETHLYPKGQKSKTPKELLAQG